MLIQNEDGTLPGPVESVADTKVVRLKSKMHHTEGTAVFENAQRQLDDLAKKIQVPDGNVIRDAAVPVDDPVNVWVVPNWVANHSTAKEAILG